MVAVPRYREAKILVSRAFRRIGKRGAVAIATVACAMVIAALVAMSLNRDGGAQKGPAALARSLMIQGEFARAADMLRAAYRANPSEELRLDLARALLSAGDYKGAIEALRTESADPAMQSARDYMRAEAFIRLHHYDEVEKIANAMTGAEYSSGRTLLILARAAYALGEFERAGALISESLRAGGEALGEAWLLRARTAFDVGDFETAKSAITRAEEAGAPQDAVAAMRVEALIRAGEFETARVMINEMHPGRKRGDRTVDPYTESMIAMLDAAKGDYLAAVRRIRPIEPWLEAMPNGPLLIAAIRIGAGDVAQAERSLRAMHASAPNNGAVLDALGDQLLSSGRDEVAKILAEEGGDSTRAKMLGLRVALKSEDFTTALAIAGQLASAEPFITPGQLILGPHSIAAAHDRLRREPGQELIDAARVLTTGSAGEAVEAARRLAESARNPASLTLAGYLYLSAGEDKAAEGVFAAALEAAPDFSPALEGRVRVAVRAWDLSGAEALLRNALEETPDRLALQGLLARVLINQERSGEAARILKPNERKLVGDPAVAEIYGAALGQSGDMEGLARFAEKMRRSRPADPVTVKLLGWAGLADWAAVSARAALEKAPDDPERGRAYRSAMARIGKADEAEAFFSGISKGDGERTPSLEQGLARENTLSAKRFAYLANPAEAVAASQFGTALSRIGMDTQAIRVMREAAFWGAAGAIQPETEIRS